jgi:hypothetical protein
VAIDSGDNVIVGGHLGESDTNGQYTGVVAKYNGTTGEAIWAKTVDGAEGDQIVNGLAVDNNDNIYAISNWYYGSNTPRLFKFDSDGNKLWELAINGGLSYMQVSGVGVDADGNVLFGGRYDGDDNTTPNQGYLVVKVDSNGNVLWQRDITSAGSDGIYQHYNNTNYNTLAVRGNRFSVVGYSDAVGNSDSQGVLVDLPTDGSGEGTYGPFIYKKVEYTIDYWTNYSADDKNVYYHNLNYTVDDYFTNDYPPSAIFSDRTSINWPALTGAGAEVTGVAGIVFEDGSRQDISAQDIPQVSRQLIGNDRWYNDYMLRLEDRGHHIYTANDNYRTIYVPRNVDVQFPIGTVITIVTGDQNDLYLQADNWSDTRIVGVGNDVYYSNYHLLPLGMVTLLKVDRDTWYLTGTFEAN